MATQTLSSMTETIELWIVFVYRKFIWCCGFWTFPLNYWEKEHSHAEMDCSGFTRGYFFFQTCTKSNIFPTIWLLILWFRCVRIYQRLRSWNVTLSIFVEKDAFSFSGLLKLYLSGLVTDKHHAAPGDPPPPDPPSEQIPAEESIWKQISQQRKANIQGKRNTNAALLHFYCINTTISCISAAPWVM